MTPSFTPTILPVLRTGSGATTLVLMHFFGSSKQAWNLSTPILGEKFDCAAIDMPGFGDAARVDGYTVAEMAGSVRRTVESLSATKIVLVGHSMSGKVTAVLASQGLDGLAGVVLVTPSPPEPEPMTEAGRKKMLGFGRNEADAIAYLDGVTAQPLIDGPRRQGIEDFIRCNPAAWTAWLERGSREDWADRVGVLGLPALVITGQQDPSLGLSAQKQTTLRHVPDAQVEDIPNCGHVPMLETAGRLSGVIARFAEGL